MQDRSADRQTAAWPGRFGFVTHFDASEISRLIQCRSIAIVGNARSLVSSSSGQEIDSCDIVVRLNSAPGCAPNSHGVKTTLLAVSTVVPKERLRQLEPDIVLWMTPRRWFQAVRMRFSDVPVSCFPKTWWRELSARLDGARPSTGMMTIDFLTRLGTFRELKLFGFDFFQSGSLSVRRSSAPIPHDFARERELVFARMRHDSRISLMGCGEGSPHFRGTVS